MRRPALLVLLLFVLAAVLRLRNAWVALPLSGYAGPFHAANIGILHFEGRLPLPDEGWHLHPPLYYALCALVWRLLPPELESGVVLFALRAVNVASGLVVGLAAWAIARRLLPERPWVPVYAAALALFLPMLIGPSSLLGNEILAAALCGISVWLLLRCLERPASLGRAAALGTGLGLAVLTKANALPVLAACVAMLGLRALQARGLRPAALGAPGVVAACALLVAGWWYVPTVQRFGTLPVLPNEVLTRAMTRQGYGPPREIGAYFDPSPQILLRPVARRDAVWPATFASVWFDVHGTTTFVHDPQALWFRRLLVACGAAFTLLAAVAWVAWWRGSFRVAVPMGASSLLAVAAAAVASYVAFTFRVATASALKGSYLAPAVTAFTFFAAAGLEHVGRRGDRLRTGAHVFLAAFVAAVCAISWIGWLAPMPLNPAGLYLRAWSDAATERVYEIFVGGLPEGVASASREPRHLVLITVDTLRADHLGCYGSDLGLTPRLDELAARSTRFTRAYAPVPYTLPSLAALLTGRHPGETGVLGNRSRLPRGLPTLAVQLRRRGWRTGAVVSSAILRRSTRIGRGFEVYDQELEQREGVRRWVEERVAGPTTDAAIQVLERLLGGEDAPAFLWVHYQDPHGAYTPPPGHRERYLARERVRPDGRRELPRSDARGVGGIPRFQYIEPHAEVAWYRAGYAGEVAYLDAQVGRLLDWIDARPELADAVLIFTSDHGEDLGERDHWFAHGEFLTEATLRVPLLIHRPGAPPATRDDLVTLLDLLPTIDAMFSLDLRAPMEGRDLFAEPAPQSEPALFVTTGPEASSRGRVGIVRGGYKLVRELEGGAERLYRLDPEGAESAAESPEVSSTLRATLDERLAALPEHPPPPKRRLSPDQIRRLRALGYLD